MHDNYYKDITHLSFEERSKRNFDHPNSLDTSLLIDHIKHLKKLNAIEVPNYDFSLHARTAHTNLISPKKIILVEGILILSDPELADQLDIKVFVDTEPDVRFMRRMQRDIVERGRSIDNVTEQYTTTVRPMHIEFVEPTKKIADIIIPGGQKNDVGLKILINHLKAEAILI